MVTSLTGSLFLLIDKPERYRTPFADPAQRAAPVLVTMPAQLYDVDPLRPALLARVDSEVSGRDPKPFDAGLTPAAHLYLLDVNRPFGSWAVLGRTGGEFDGIRFDELGWKHPGFSVFQGDSVAPDDHETRERPARYCVHPPMALDRLHYDPNTRQVSYDPKNHDRGAGPDSAASTPCSALDFLAALCTHIPDAGQQLIRYYG